MTDATGKDAAPESSTPAKPLAGNPPQEPRIEVVFVEEPTEDMAELVPLEELIPDDGLSNDADEDARQPRGGDFLGSTALIILLVIMNVVLVIVGFTSFGAQALACDVGGCNGSVISLSTQVVIFGLPLLSIATIVVTIVRITRRKLAFPVPLIGIAVSLLVYIVAAFLVGQAVPA